MFKLVGERGNSVIIMIQVQGVHREGGGERRGDSGVRGRPGILRHGGIDTQVGGRPLRGGEGKRRSRRGNTIGGVKVPRDDKANH